MSIRHLNELENVLNRARWQVVERVDRKVYRDPCFWLVARPDGTSKFKILFLDDPDKDAQTVLDSFHAETELENVPAYTLHVAHRGAKNYRHLLTKLMP